VGEPGVLDDGVRDAALARTERIPQKRVMTIVPSRFDEHAAQMRIPDFGDRPANAFGAGGIFRRHEPHEAHQTGGGWESTWVAELGGDGQRGEIIDAAEAAQAFDAGAERLEREKLPQFEIHRLQSRDSFIHGADVGAMRLFEGGQGPALDLQPLGVPLGPGAFGRGEAPPVSQEEVQPRSCVHRLHGLQAETRTT